MLRRVRASTTRSCSPPTAGRVGFCVDPIEKKPLNHFLPGSAVLSFGTAGCNLACKFCQNWDISKSREIDTLADRATPGRLARAADELGCRSVAFTYNDPTIFWEYAIDVADACHERGIKAVAVTAGYMCPRPARRVLSAHRRGQRRSEGVHRGVLSPGLRRASGRRARHPRLSAARDRRVGGDHHTAHSRTERQRRRDRRRVRLDPATTSASMCRCISPRFTPTTRCWTSRRRRPRR